MLLHGDDLQCVYCHFFQALFDFSLFFSTCSACSFGGNSRSQSRTFHLLDRLEVRFGSLSCCMMSCLMVFDASLLREQTSCFCTFLYLSGWCHRQWHTGESADIPAQGIITLRPPMNMHLALWRVNDIPVCYLISSIAHVPRDAIRDFGTHESIS